MTAPAPPPTAAIWLRLTGAPAIGRTGEPGQPLERKDAALLLLLASEGPLPPQQVAAWLWPGARAQAASGNLRQRLFRLRRKLDHPLVRATDRLDLLPEVQLVWDDHAGPLLAGCDYGDCPDMAAWLEQAREQRQARRLQQHADQALRLEGSSDLAGALAEVQAMLALDPWSEHSSRWLMRLHYLRGDGAAAIAAFERLEQRLKDEFGIRPGAETLALLASIETQPAPLPPPRRSLPASLQRPPRLVGRADALARLHDAWAAGHVWLVLGEAGMGKTRLLAELAASHADSSLHVAARPGDAGVPFALLSRLLRLLHERGAAAADGPSRQALARLLPALGDGLPPPSDPAQRLPLVRATATLLQAAQSLPATGLDTVLVDDLHFADDASLDLLRDLIAADYALPLRWGLARRPGEAGQALHAALAESQRLHELTLPPLDEAAMQALVGSLGLPELNAAALATPLVRHTGGNPLFALETLKDHLLAGHPGAALPQPASVGVLIERRLRALSPPALALARVAAIAGADFGIGLAEAVLQRPAIELADAWSELQTARVLSGRAFAHDLVADAALRLVPDEIGRHLHGAVAGWLQAQQADPARCAEHWHAAGRWPQAAAAFEQAAVRARGVSRLAEALSLERQAAAHWQAAGDRNARWRCELRSVETCVYAEGVDKANALAERLADEASDDAERIAAAEARGLVLLNALRHGDCVDAVAPALALADQMGRPGLALGALRLWCQAQAYLGQLPQAIERLQQSIALVDREGSLRQRWEHRASLASVYNEAGRLADCRSALREVIGLAREAGDRAEIASSLANLAVVEATSGYAATGLALGHEAAAQQQALGMDEGPHGLALALHIGMFATYAGDLALALRQLEPAPQRLAALGSSWTYNAHNHLAALWLLLGQWHRAERCLADPGDAQTRVFQPRRLSLCARLARWRGRPQGPHRDALEQTLARHTDNRQGRASLGLRLELSHWLDETPSALALVREVQAEARASGQLGFELHAWMRELQLLLVGAAAPAAVGALLDRLEGREAGLLPTDAYLPELWATMARAHLQLGRTDSAHELVARSRNWIAARAAELPAGLRRIYLENNPAHHALAQLA